MNNNGDPLAEQLRREAMADRPAFSSRLHDRIIERIDDERAATRRIMPIRWRAAAAAILLAGGITAAWLMHSPPKPVAIQPVEMVSNDSRTMTVELNGLLFAKFSPDGIVVRSPIGEASYSKEPPPHKTEPVQPAVVPASPEWLLDQLQTPASSARLALADMIPPHVRELAGWSKSRQ